MLILTRRVGESIKIADDITVVVLGVKGHQVRLGIEAPRGVAVDRKEIAERKAASLLRPAVADREIPNQPTEPLYANRTEAEWRQLLADEAEEQAAWDKEFGHDAA